MRLVDALRHRDFRFFFTGQAVSQLGDGVFFLAVAWHALQLGGASGVGIVVGAFSAAQVALLLVGGLLVDRLPRRRLLIASDVAQGALALGLAASTFAGAATLPLLIVFSAGFGAAQAVAMPALSAVIPDTVPRAHLTSANSLYQGTRTVATVAGPLLGGALVALWGPGAAYAVDGATFAISATLLLVSNIRPPAPMETTNVLKDAREGARYVAQRPWLWIGIAVFSLYNVAEAGARNVGFPVFADAELATGAEGLGLMYGGSAAGAILGYAVLGSLDYTRLRGYVAYGGALVGGLAMAALAWAPGVVAAVALSAARGLAIAGFTLTWETAIQSSVASGMRGRVVSLDMLGSFALLPLAMPAFGVVLESVGARTTFLWSGIAMVLFTLPGLLSRQARALGDARASPDET